MQGAHAGRRRHRRAAGTAAGGPARVPRVAGDARQGAVGHALPAELRCGGLAEQHRPVLAHPRHERRDDRSEEHTSEIQSLMRHSYAAFSLSYNLSTSNSKVAFYTSIVPSFDPWFPSLTITSH